MASAKNKRVVSAEVPLDVIERLDDRAKSERRKRNEVVNRALLFYLEYAEVEPAVEVVDLPKIKRPRKES